MSLNHSSTVTDCEGCSSTAGAGMNRRLINTSQIASAYGASDKMQNIDLLNASSFVHLRVFLEKHATAATEIRSFVS